MSTALQILGAEDGLRDKIADKMKAVLIDAIPKEKMDSLVEHALDEFLHGPRVYRFITGTCYMKAEDPRNPTGVAGEHPFETELREPRIPGNRNSTYSHHHTDDKPYIVTQDPNTLPGMVYAMIKEHCQKEAQKLFAGPEYTGNGDWNGENARYFSGVVAEYLEKNTDTFVKLMFSNIVSQAMMHMRSNLANIR